ncbi:MAG: GNAT family N-acetyltransferase [Deltaproteobacteria bacterium]
MPHPGALELEQQVVEAWPAAETEELDGWLLRASGGPTHRGNSTATLGAGSVLSLEQRIESTERWYAERNRGAMIQIGPCAQPGGLDQKLQERGYRKQGDSVAAVAPSATVAQRTPTELRTLVELQPGPAWLGIAEGSSRHASSKDIFRHFLLRLGARCRYVTAWLAPDQPAAICLGITSPGRLGVYAMHTVPELRKRGAARAVLHALARHALDSDGYPELYLLVDAQNTPARALYAQSGFQDVYGYHYRVQSGP